VGLGEENPGLAGFVQRLKGKTELECADVCAAVGRNYTGHGLSRDGAMRTWRCECAKAIVEVSCIGKPFEQCCEGRCSVGTCDDKPGGWTCPKDFGCPSGDCTAGGEHWQQWVAAINIYRCMHDVPPVVWSPEVYADAASTFAYQQDLAHSDCFHVPAPAGPAAENLFKPASYLPTPLEAVSAWYSEIADCGPFPGCRAGASGPVAHFTALVWDGAQEIGCLVNDANIAVCRYKGHNFASCATPNSAGAAAVQNVFKRRSTYRQCVLAVHACGLEVSDAPHASIDETSGFNAVFEDGPNIRYRGPQRTASTGRAGTVVALSVMATMVVVAMGYRGRITRLAGIPAPGGYSAPSGDAEALVPDGDAALTRESTLVLTGRDVVREL